MSKARWRNLWLVAGWLGGCVAGPVLFLMVLTGGDLGWALRRPVRRLPLMTEGLDMAGAFAGGGLVVWLLHIVMSRPADRWLTGLCGLSGAMAGALLWGLIAWYVYDPAIPVRGQTIDDAVLLMVVYAVVGLLFGLRCGSAVEKFGTQDQPRETAVRAKERQAP